MFLSELNHWYYYHYGNVGIQLVRQLSIWMTDTFNLKYLDVYFLLYLYVESVNKLSIYLSNTILPSGFRN